MSDIIKTEFKNSIDELHFTPAAKERMCRKLEHSPANPEGSKKSNMKKWSITRTAAAAAVCLMLTGIPVLASTGITQWVSGTRSAYEYHSPEEMTVVQKEAQGDNETPMPAFPKSFDNGFVFDGGNKVNTSGLDAGQNIIQKWIEAEGYYKNTERQTVSLTMSYIPPSETDIAPTESRMIGDIPVNYDYSEYLFVPVGYEMDEAIKNRMETDDHFQISDGTDDVETVYYSSVSFVREGISYLLLSSDEVSADELFDMAQELINE